MPSISATMLPWLGRTIPMMHFMSVDLPLPLVPSSTTVSRSPRSAAGATAPARGLHLYGVGYGGERVIG